MKSYHWLTLVVVIVVAYYAGMKGWLGKARNAAGV